MGGLCCKRLDSPASPQLPVCEVLRRCARQLCPLEPTIQKPVQRARKYGLSDIVGPVVKKDSWVQTDPLPPPRRKKKAKDKRKRSKSAEFLPYLIQDRKISSVSLGDITGQEDIIDFQMYFMGRFLRSSITSNDERNESISRRKKDFLSGLLGEENNNLPALRKTPSPESEPFDRSNATQEDATTDALETNSRRSSITESLKEFESSLLDMLQDGAEEEEEAMSSPSHELGYKRSRSPQLKTKEVEPPPLKEVKDEEYILTPLEEENEEDIWNSSIHIEKITRRKSDIPNVILMSEGRASVGLEKHVLQDEDLPDETIELRKHQPPITVETFS